MEDKKELLTVYITKYWETKGIYELKVVKLNDGAVKGVGNKWSYFGKKQWWSNYQDATLHVNALRDIKIKSLLGKIEKLKNLIV